MATWPIARIRLRLAAALTPEQRAEVVQTLRQALRDDPSILRDALARCRPTTPPGRTQTNAGAIAAQHAALFADRPMRWPAIRPATSRWWNSTTRAARIAARCCRCWPTLLQADPQVRLVFKDIPILGPASVLEARRACWRRSGKGGYLPFQDAIMHSTAHAHRGHAAGGGRTPGLDGARFEHDMADPAIQARLDKNLPGHRAACRRHAGPGDRHESSPAR